MNSKKLPAALLLAGHPSDVCCSSPLRCVHAATAGEALHIEAWTPLMVRGIQRAVLSHSQLTRRGLRPALYSTERRNARAPATHVSALASLRRAAGRAGVFYPAARRAAARHPAARTSSAAGRGGLSVHARCRMMPSKLSGSAVKDACAARKVLSKAHASWAAARTVRQCVEL